MKRCVRCRRKKNNVHLHHWKRMTYLQPICTDCYKVIQKERKRGILPT